MGAGGALARKPDRLQPRAPLSGGFSSPMFLAAQNATEPVLARMERWVEAA